MATFIQLDLHIPLYLGAQRKGMVIIMEEDFILQYFRAMNMITANSDGEAHYARSSPDWAKDYARLLQSGKIVPAPAYFIMTYFESWAEQVATQLGLMRDMSRYCQFITFCLEQIQCGVCSLYARYAIGGFSLRLKGKSMTIMSFSNDHTIALTAPIIRDKNGSPIDYVKTIFSAKVKLENKLDAKKAYEEYRRFIAKICDEIAAKHGIECNKLIEATKHVLAVDLWYNSGHIAELIVYLTNPNQNPYRCCLVEAINIVDDFILPVGRNIMGVPIPELKKLTDKYKDFINTQWANLSIKYPYLAYIMLNYNESTLGYFYILASKVNSQKLPLKVAVSPIVFDANKQIISGGDISFTPAFPRCFNDLVVIAAGFHICG